MGNFKIGIEKFGEEYLLINWPKRIDPSISEELLQFEALLLNRFPEEIIESNPTYASLCIRFDWRQISYVECEEKITATFLNFNHEKPTEKSIWEIPVCYHPELAPDLLAFCKQKRISTVELIDLHTAPGYKVYFMGFLPGFLYLGGLDPKLNLARKANPRQSVPKGAVGIAGNQTGIYPQQSPGGWNLIGRSPIEIFQEDRNPPTIISAGDTVKFNSISLEEFENIQKQVHQKSFSLTPRIISNEG